MRRSKMHRLQNGVIPALVLATLLAIGCGAKAPPTSPPVQSKSTATPLPRPTSVPLILDVLPLVFKTHAEVEKLIGTPEKTESVFPVELVDLPRGGTDHQYHTGQGRYSFDVYFDDTLGLSRGVGVNDLKQENTTCSSAWRLIERLGVIVPAKADQETAATRKWFNRSGYNIYAFCLNAERVVEVIEIWRAL
jgi:hypothetical protein